MIEKKKSSEISFHSNRLQFAAKGLRAILCALALLFVPTVSAIGKCR